MHYWVIALIAGIGVVGGFMNVFIGDTGLHRPKVEDGVWQPGFLGVILVGGIAALGSWATLKAIDLIHPGVGGLPFGTGDVANALVVGFGGAKWFKSESEKGALQKAASIAAEKRPDLHAAMKIARSTPFQALHTAVRME